MSQKTLIVGAGPVGLACALFLQAQKIPFRIIDKIQIPSTLSKAIAIHARTLELLQKIGLDQELIQEGHKMRGMSISMDGRPIQIDFSVIKNEHKYTLILPQAKTEAFFEKKLGERGVQIERGVELTEFHAEGNKYRITLKKGESEEISDFDILIGADGMHSTVREKAKIGFPGKNYDTPITALDAYLDTTLTKDELHLFVDSKKGVFTLIVCLEGDLFRIISTNPHIESHLPSGVKLTQKSWDSRFYIHNKNADSYHLNQIYLMGDAAHVHSPLGGRGMNLGIEDAYTFVELYKSGKLTEYTNMRKAKSIRVLRETDKATKILTSQGIFARLIKQYLFPWLIKNRFIRSKIINRNMGIA